MIVVTVPVPSSRSSRNSNWSVVVANVSRLGFFRPQPPLRMKPFRLYVSSMGFSPELADPEPPFKRREMVSKRGLRKSGWRQARAEAVICFEGVS